MIEFVSFGATKLALTNVGVLNGNEALSHKKNNKQNVNEIADEVNTKGWNMSGWLQCTGTIDASPTNGNEIDMALFSQLHHVSHLWPSDKTS